MIVLKIIAFIWVCQIVLWITEIASRAVRYRMDHRATAPASAVIGHPAAEDASA